MRKNKIVVYGGSFNPPINSHFFIAEQVLNQFEEVDKILFVPVSNSYEKTGLLDEKYRYTMLKMVIDHNPDFLLSDMDLNKKRSLTTIEVLEKAKQQFPENEIWLLLGSDNLKEFSIWNQAEDILRDYDILVMERDADQLTQIINHDELLRKYQQKIKAVNEKIRSNYNATYVRELISHQKSVRYLIPEEIREYIEKNHLYQGSEKYD